jgi:hypothetical protein
VEAIDSPCILEVWYILSIMGTSGNPAPAVHRGSNSELKEFKTEKKPLPFDHF